MCGIFAILAISWQQVGDIITHGRWSGLRFIKRGGGFVTADHEIVTTFESKLTDGITLEYKDVKIILVPELGLGTMPTAALSTDGKVVTYEMNDVTSFVYELTYAGFKEDIVVEEYTGQTEYEFILFTNGLTLCEEYGSYYLADAEGNIEATIGDIIVFTSDERNNTMGIPSTTKTYTITTTCSSGADLDCMLYDNSGVMIGSSTPPGQVSITIRLVAGQKYYFDVYNYNKTVTDYTFSIS